MMVMLPLFCVMLLQGCKTTANTAKYDCRNWPEYVTMDSQRDVARYIVKGHAAWKDCYDTVRIMSK